MLSVFNLAQEAPVEEEDVKLVEVELPPTNPKVAEIIESEDMWLPLSQTLGDLGPVPTKSDVLGYTATGAGYPEFSEESEISFVLNVFKLHNTVFMDVWPQLLCSMVWCAFITIIYNWKQLFETRNNDDKDFAWNMWKEYGIPTDINPSLISTVLGFLLVFKAGQGYGNFKEGRGQLGGICNHARELAQEIYAHPLKDQDPATVEKAEKLRKIIRRKLNLMFALMRQAAREAHEGFIPGSDFEVNGIDFKAAGADANWFKDPCRPQIADLVSIKEKEELTGITPPPNRASFVQAEINMLCGELSKEMKYADFFLTNCHLNTEGMMNLYKGIVRLVTTPVPMPYTHMLYVLVFLFCFLMPIYFVDDVGALYPSAWNTDAYQGNGATYFTFAAGWSASILVIITNYGILEIAAKLQNPFGHDAIDHDVGLFAKRLSSETRVVSKASLSQDLTDYMKPAVQASA